MRFKKHEGLSFGIQALDLKLPFGEIEVLQDNLDLIKKQIGIDHVEILVASDPAAIAKADRHASLLRQTPPSPGAPIPIFLSRAGN